MKTTTNKPANVLSLPSAYRYDLASIMSNAWTIRKDSAASMGCRISEVVMGECLKMAWAVAEGANAADNAAEVVKAWADMPNEEKVTMMKRCIRKAAKNEIGYSCEDHYIQFAEVPAFYLFRQHDFDEFISETWLRVAASLGDLDKLTARNEKRAAQGKRPVTLVSVVYNGARASIAAIAYADSKHAAASDFEVMNDNGESFSYIETGAADSTANTENAAIIRGAFEDMAGGLDPVDSRLWEFVQRGYTERKMAAMLTAEGLGMSNVAVHKRVVKLRARLQEMVG